MAAANIQLGKQITNYSWIAEEAAFYITEVELIQSTEVRARMRVGYIMFINYMHHRLTPQFSQEGIQADTKNARFPDKQAITDVMHFIWTWRFFLVVVNLVQMPEFLRCTILIFSHVSSTVVGSKL